MSRSNRPSTRSLALASLLSLSSFPVLVIALNVIQSDHYSGIREAMSNLALGRAGWLMTLAFILLAVGSILLGATIRRATGRAIIAPALLAVVGLLTFISAGFQTDPDGATASFHGQVHMVAGVTTFLVLVATIAASSISFRRTPSWRWFSIPSMIWAVIAFATFFLVPTMPDAYFGVAQRIFVGTCLAWMILAAALASRAPATDAETAANTLGRQAETAASAN